MTGPRRYWPLIAVGALLAAVTVTAALGTPTITHLPPLTNREKQGDTLGSPSPSTAASPISTGNVQHDVGLPGWLSTVISDLITVLCIGLVLAVAGYAIWYLTRGGADRSRALGIETPVLLPQRDSVLAAVDAGLSELDDDDVDPRRAVIACWVRLEQAAAAAGTPRAAGDTPTEMVTRLLAAHQVSAPVLYALAEVYRRARYATHDVDSGMREQAKTALRQLRAELTVSHSGPLEHEPPVRLPGTRPEPLRGGGEHGERQDQPGTWPGSTPIEGGRR
jgi:hypothetical protein